MSETRYDVMILSGAFDPLHVGHIRMIQDARVRAGLLVVGVNSDAWVEERKGRCLTPREERVEILASIRGVTSAVVFDDADGTASELIRRVRTMAGRESTIAFGNGGPRTEENVPEIDVCRELGVDLVWGVGGRTARREPMPWPNF